MQGITEAREVVAYSKSQPNLLEVNHSKYLKALTTRRSFFHITRADIENQEQAQILKKREVVTFPGETFHANHGNL